ncbi:MAG: HD-GYP domain-containing protein [Synergistales bacterium]|nr:HD-GYP domain-containing protein [Synergistales bacterium]
MMLATKDLRPGLVLGEDIRNTTGNTLLARGVVLNERYIRRLEKSGVQFVKIALTPDEEKPGSPSHLNDTRARQIQHEITHIHQIFAEKKTLDRKLLKELTENLTSLIKDILAGDDQILREIRYLSSHDQYTYEHSWMVMVTAVLLAAKASEQELIPEMSYQDQVNLALGTSLHDLGKVNIPDTILNKPGRLEEQEMDIMKEHPQHGFDLIRNNPNIHPMAKAIVLHHHQRWDGSGYGPKSGDLMAGKEIPPLVRIASLADVYDALVTDRPYRAGFLPQKALDIIDSESGGYFDPTLVPLFTAIAPPYPAGSLLFTTEGLIGATLQAYHKPPVNIYVIASLSQETKDSVGAIRKAGKDDILTGGTSLNGLAEHIGKLPGLPPALQDDRCTLTTLDSWRGPIHSALGFLTKRCS